MPRPARIFRPMTAEQFPAADIVAVHDQVDNVVIFNTTFAGDATLEHRALFMDLDGAEPILRLPPDYVFR